ncbi:MAG: TPM domain-containing protein, partial [Firmicutes bacterium]|nr:TPM domain-containing protein [Bacillota bacterium]
TILIAVIAALIVALAVVGVLKGQLKQAVYESAAANYVREGSFQLDVKIDHFLYERTERRKIEQPKKN